MVMKVIITIDDKCFRYNLSDKYLKYDKGQIILPFGENFKFNSLGYVNRVWGCEWSDFKDINENIINNILYTFINI